MSKKSPKTMARDALKLQAKIIKAIDEIQSAERNLDAWREAYTRLPADVEEARARYQSDQDKVTETLAELTKPLENYRYDGGDYGYRRYSSEKAQAAWDATIQADHSRDRLEILQTESAKTMDEYTKPGIECLSAAWDAWHEHNTLMGATMARIRSLMKQDVIDLATLSKDAPKPKSEESEECKMHHVDIPDVKVHAEELYKAARAIRISKQSSLPVLNHVLVRVTDDGLKVYTRTLEEETARSETVNCWANGTRWETCVPARTFTDWLRVMAEYSETLTLTFDPSVQILQAKTPTSRTEFKCLDAQEFPPC